MKKHLLETLTIVVVAVVLALVSNAFADRSRALSLTQTYAAPTRDGQPPAEAMILENQPELETEGSPDVAQPAGTTGVPAGTGSDAPAPAPPPATADLLERFPPTEQLPHVDISGDDAEFLYSQGALFLDARRTADYERGHIAGARSFPVWESDIDDRVTSFAGRNFDPNTPIVVYCSGGDCEDSHMLAQKLWGQFFNNVLVYKDGFPDWQQRGGEVRTGARP